MWPASRRRGPSRRRRRAWSRSERPIAAKTSRYVASRISAATGRRRSVTWPIRRWPASRSSVNTASVPPTSSGTTKTPPSSFGRQSRRTWGTNVSSSGTSMTRWYIVATTTPSTCRCTKRVNRVGAHLVRVTHVHQQQQAVRTPRRLLGTSNHFGRERRRRHVVADEPDRVRSARPQRASQRVRPIPNLAGRGAHTFPRRRRDHALRQRR